MKKAIPILLCTLILGLFSCDKGFEELNTNPLAPTEVNYEALFNELCNSLRLGWNRQLFLNNEILYDVTELGVVTAQTFGNVDAGAEDVWTNYYTALSNSRQLKDNLNALGTIDPAVGDLAKAQINILMAYKTFQVIDLFGDIPYSEAGQAYAEIGVVRPVYDKQKDIYLSLLDDLIAASDLLNNAGDKTEVGNPYLRFGGHDALFKDNLDRWIKFSNSLQLKYLIRITELEPTLVNERIAFMLEQGYGFLNPGEDVVMRPEDQGWSNEGVNWSFREHNKLRMGSTLWNFLTQDNEILDPRLAIFCETNNNDEWVPFPQVSSSSTLQSGGAPYDKDIRDNVYSNKGEGNIYSSFNFYLVRDEESIPEILMSAAEVKFLLAEMFLRGIGTPKDESIASFRYQEGMLASMDFWQEQMLGSTIWGNQSPLFSTGDMFNVTEHPKFKFEVGADENENLAKIYAQRWVDYFRQPWEAFNLIRQSNLLPREKPANDFYRFRYPQSESSFNGENYSQQAAEMGGDETNVKLWWMD